MEAKDIGGAVEEEKTSSVMDVVNKDMDFTTEDDFRKALQVNLLPLFLL